MQKLSDIEHERMRFKTMTKQELSARLKKITKENKLKCFIFVCEEYGYAALREEARLRLNKIMFGVESLTTQIKKLDPESLQRYKTKKPEEIKEIKKTIVETPKTVYEQQFKRSIEF